MFSNMKSCYKSEHSWFSARLFLRKRHAIYSHLFIKKDIITFGSHITPTPVPVMLMDPEQFTVNVFHFFLPNLCGNNFLVRLLIDN